ncbi:MAG: GlcNAc-transferase family protein [Acidobacteriota bacterium]
MGPPSPSIFVAIASYADPELPRTLRDALETARTPDRLRFGICLQDDPDRPLDVSEFRHSPLFRWVDKTIHESQGGPWARNICQSLWRGEPYTLQVDSHMKFEPDWDQRLIDMLEDLPVHKAVLTMNAPLFWHDEEGRLHRKEEMGVPTTKVTSWESSGGWAPWFDFGPPNDRQPARSRFVNGNFAFSRGEWNLEVPQDPAHYYWGEEFNVTVRSYTWGWDFFLPPEVVVWHQLHPTAPRRHWEHGEAVVQRRNREALARLHGLLFGDGFAFGPYGLGRVRTRRSYEIYAGFDFRRRRAHPDVFTGAAPDPVTLRGPEDWDLCLTTDEARAQGLLPAA